MRLYFHPLSTCSRRVLLTVHLLDVPVERVVVDLTRGEQFAPAFLALNPNHRVPVLEHEGWVLWESYAIMEYLAAQVPGQTLLPADPRGRAEVSRWMHWCGQDFMPGISTLNWEHHIKPLVGQGAPDAARVAQGRTQVRTAAEVLNAHLAGRDWVAPHGLSLADLALAAPLADQDAAQLPVHDLPHLQRWLAQVQALPAWAATQPAAVAAAVTAPQA
ncbi:glutathione S-transferase family protein [Ideonella livida]|uniref:Glutathione S-transferase family protein n=1 Tax=Ideonella livida TaxID=2707176 RepID=A0A7C9TLU9_9BURK|nr:glutathione S-transferase family protein [Ideonella livida]NDY93438.1 glutathione S-transferase family protein [Ideonella livida]